MEIKVNVRLILDDIVESLTPNEAMELIKNIDLAMADTEFTEEIILYLAKDLEKGEPDIYPEYLIEKLRSK